MTWFANTRERITVRNVDTELIHKIKTELNVPQGIASILVGRNLTTFDSCKQYFRPDTANMLDSFLFRDMTRAVDRIRKALQNNEKIVVYGDYDVDGVTSTAVMVKVLRALGAECDFYLPNRLTDGYGLSESGVRQIASSGARLMVTVDCGVTATHEIALAASLGIDSIVTDHHEPKDLLPQAVAIINPKVEGETFPDKNLAGVGVAFKLCQALVTSCNADTSLWSNLLDLVALGTAADIVPLVGENRIIAKLGFKMLSNPVHPGLAALVKQQGLLGKPVSTSQVVFQIAPCINAVGRIGDPRRGVDMLLTNDASDALMYAAALRDANVERRTLDNTVADEACAWVQNNCSPDQDYALVVGKENWHVGVIGIVASKLVEKFYRPSVLFSIGADGLAKGSGRSIPGVHLLDALDKCSDVLESYGGHAAAAGMSCTKENIDKFRVRFNDVIKSMLKPDDLIPQVVADAEVTFLELSPKFCRIIKEMEPFGPGNMRPVLYCKGLKHKYSPKIVGNKHVKMALIRDGITMDAIGFNLGERFKELKAAENVTMAFSLDENEWNGKVSLQMKVKGFSV
jgi:single-stranded-DNA-specific exonuclease